MLTAGCGGDSVDPAATTAVAGDAYTSIVSKPMTPGAALASTAALNGTPRSPVDMVPTVVGKTPYGIPTTATAGVGSSLGGTVVLPFDDLWNRDVTNADVDRSSPALIAAIGAQSPLRLGFGALAGVPYAVVDRSQSRVNVRVAGADPVRAWPVPVELIASADASARLSVVDRDAGMLYELHGASRRADGGIDAVALAVWRLDVRDGAPTDAAGAALPDGGMPVFPGLVRRDEADTGIIRHALRVVVPALRGAWLPPARGAAANAADAALPPIGLRLRLKAGVAIPADASPQARAILQALKTFGMIVSGVGTALTLEGVPDRSWDTAMLSAELAGIRGEHFEAISMDGLVTP